MINRRSISSTPDGIDSLVDVDGVSGKVADVTCFSESKEIGDSCEFAIILGFSSHQRLRAFKNREIVEQKKKTTFDM